ncbi:hypothetical protein GCM10009415_18590 [Chitinophaga japonensis]
MFSCSSPDRLDSSSAKDLLGKELGYPRNASHTLNTADPVQAVTARASDLVDSGLLKVYPVGTVIPKGHSLIELTEKGKEYLLPPAEGQEPYKLKIRLATATIDSTSIHVRNDTENKMAEVTFDVLYSDITPFAQMVPQRNFKEKQHETVTFSQMDDGSWQLQER